MNIKKPKFDPTPQRARIDTLSHEGRGVARIEGKATFIQGALPQEEVEFQYTKRKKSFDEGRLLAIIEASPLRVEPKCPHYDLCGACSLQHLKTEEQIHVKEEHLLDLLSRFAQTQPFEILKPLTADAWHYRNRARLSVRFVEKKQSALVGFRERNNPRYITEITQCSILNEQVGADITPLRNLINSFEDKHSIAQIEVAAGDKEIVLIFRNLNPLSQSDQDKLREFGAMHNFLIFLQPGGPDTIHNFYPPRTNDYISYDLPAYNLSFQFHPSDFTQINAKLNRAMVALALELLDLKTADKVLDLFCGLGNFTLPIAKFCNRVIGIEGSPTMVERAYMNAKANGIDNAEFYAANLDDAGAVQEAVQQTANKLLLDPPRSGALELVKQIEILNPERIVYVSCNPVTLARDADILVNQKGYILEKAGVMDMFPHTAHVESIALFVKG